MEKWRMGNPEHVYERIELEQTRKEERMGRHFKEIPDYMMRDLHQWGDWARRPQFWANLGITPFCKLVGLSFGGREPNIKLDPQSMMIHKAVMLLDDAHKIIMYAYYVANIGHNDAPKTFNGHGISKKTYERRLVSGSVRAHGNAMRWLEQTRNNQW